MRPCFLCNDTPSLQVTTIRRFYCEIYICICGTSAFIKILTWTSINNSYRTIIIIIYMYVYIHVIKSNDKRDHRAVAILRELAKWLIVKICIGNMFIFPEIVLLCTGIIDIITAIILILVILISRCRTSTHLYIMEVSFLCVVQQFVSPLFHHIYIDNLRQIYNVREVLTMSFFVVLLGIIVLLLLIFLMDYFRWIGEYKFIVMALHAITMVCTGFFYYYVVEGIIWLLYIIVAIDLCAFLVLFLIFLLHRDLECLKKKQQTDEESRLRYLLILVFLSVNVSALLLFLVEAFVALWIDHYMFGFLSVGLMQLQPTFFLFVAFKIDHKFRTNFVNFFKMCSPRRADKVQFERLPNDNV